MKSKKSDLGSTSQKNSFAGQMSWSIVASFFNLIGRLIASIIIARALGTDGAGRIAYLIWIADTTNILTNLGLRNSLTRFLAEIGGEKDYQRQRALASWIFQRYLFLIIVGACGVGLIGKLYLVSFDNSIAIWILLVLIFLGQGFQNIYQSYLTGIQRFDILSRINAFASVSLVLGIASGVYFFGLTGVLGGYVIGTCIPAFCSFSILRGSRPASFLDTSLRQRVWKYALYTWLAAIVSAFVWSRMEIFFIELYWNDHEVAMFSVGLTFAMLVSQTAMMMSGAFLPHFAKLSSGRDNIDAIASGYASGTRLLALILFPMAAGGAAIMPIVLPMLYGFEFVPAVPNAMVLVAASGLMFSTIGSSLVYGVERSLFIAIGGLAGAVVALIASFLIIPTWGAWGAVWSRTIIQGNMVALGMWYICIRVGVYVPLNSLLRTLFAAILCGATAWIVVSCCENPLVLLVAIPAGVAVYVCAVKLFKVISPEDILHLEQILALLPDSINKQTCFFLKWVGRIQ